MLHRIWFKQNSTYVELFFIDSCKTMLAPCKQNCDGKESQSILHIWQQQFFNYHQWWWLVFVHFIIQLRISFLNIEYNGPKFKIIIPYYKYWLWSCLVTGSNTRKMSFQLRFKGKTEQSSFFLLMNDLFHIAKKMVS